MRTILSFCCALVAICLASCGNEGFTTDRPVAVVATTTQAADLARNVGGTRTEVRGILSPNSDPHEYEPRPSDAAALADSDLIIRSGGELDDWIGDLVDAAGTGAPVLALIDAVHTRTGEAGDVDPHWWQDPRNAELAVRAIRGELSRLDPVGASAYRANAAAYLSQIRTLDRRIAACFRSIPAERRELVTSHDALAYYADRYGIDVIGTAIPALSTQAQASAGETADLIDVIRKTGVTTIFAEAGVSGGLEQAIADDAGATVGDGLWADSLGPAGSDGATYLEAEAANTEKLAAGFTGGSETCATRLANSAGSSP